MEAEKTAAIALASKRANDIKEKEKRPDQSYIREYVTYIKWVVNGGQDLRAEKENKPARFINRTAIDEYFTKAVSRRKVETTNSRSRIRSSLQWAWNRVESKHDVVQGENIAAFVVQSAITDQGEIEQQAYFNEVGSQMNLGVDPFLGIKGDLMTLAEKRVIMTNIMTRNDWQALGTSFLWGSNAGLRGASNRCVLISDMYVSNGFSPCGGPCLSIILRKGDVHKSRFTTNRLVGCIRHKDYLLCAIGITAANIISLLITLGPGFSFLRPNKKLRAPFWDVALIEYNTLNEETSAMKQVYRATGVESCKVTHHRSNAVMWAAAHDQTSIRKDT